METINDSLNQLDDTADRCYLKSANSIGFIETLSAMANTDGGVIYIGFKENQKVTGCFPDEEITTIHSFITDGLTDTINVLITKHVIKHKFILQVEVPITSNKIGVNHFNKTKDFYFRLNGSTIVVNKIVEVKWKLEKSQIKHSHSNESIGLLKVIEQHPNSTLSKLYRSSNMPLKTVDASLSLLLYLKKVEMFFEKDQIYYKIKD